MEYHFGAGAFWGNRTDVTGSGIGPDPFAVLQNITIDFGFDIRPLHGQFQFPVDVARGKGKITGKAAFARFFGAIYGDLFFGTTPTTGMTDVAENEAGTIPSSPTYTITVTNAANYVDDLGVLNATTGAKFTRVTSPSASGQYSVNTGTGVYTFAAADASGKVLISYIWTNASSGKSVAITNQLMGTTPEFKGTFYTKKVTQSVTGEMAIVLNACWPTALRLPTRLDDYEIQEFDFEAGADAANNIGTISTTE